MKVTFDTYAVAFSNCYLRFKRNNVRIKSARKADTFIDDSKSKISNGTGKPVVLNYVVNANLSRNETHVFARAGCLWEGYFMRGRRCNLSGWMCLLLLSISLVVRWYTPYVDRLVKDAGGIGLQ